MAAELSCRWLKPLARTFGSFPMGAERCSFEAVFGVPRAFWLLDLSARTSRLLTELPDDPRLGELGRFDISSDGKHIIFDRRSENSDIVLIDLPQRQ